MLNGTSAQKGSYEEAKEQEGTEIRRNTCRVLSSWVSRRRKDYLTYAVHAVQYTTKENGQRLL